MTENEGLFRATYRLQLHKDFRFKDAEALLPYLNDLGISHLYLSPVLESRSGSLHGYDGTDPRRISAERGGEAQFTKLLKKLEPPKRGNQALRGVILDIVPNHLALSSENPLWWDVLEKGPASEHWKTFDLRGKVVTLPALGRELEDCLKDGEIKIVRDKKRGFIVRYYAQEFPLRRESQEKLRRQKTAKIPAELTAEILAGQHYRLGFWRTTSKKLSYRRFFDINELVGLRVEDPDVFERVHAKIFELMERFPVIQGLRIDHVDGLLRPKEYLKRLRERCPNIWVEKILSEDEVVPYDWPVHGSTGYDFSSMATRLFANEEGHQKIHDEYVRLVDPRWKLFSDCVYESKKEMLNLLFEGELNNLVEALGKFPEAASFSADELRNALGELSVCLHVYRLYYQNDEDSVGIGQHDKRWLTEACEDARRRGNVESLACLDWMVTFLSENAANSAEKAKFLGQWQQLTGPVTAKGFEDTALYRYTPLLSLNTIGGQPDWNFETVTEFHAFNEETLRSHPRTLNASTTHDTKRNEDVRARIHVLSEIPEKWMKQFQVWRRQNRAHRTEVGGLSCPSRSFEYFVYQNLIGAWPQDGKVTAEFKGRMKDYFLKAVREEKVESSWLSPNEAYEKGLFRFLDRILSPKSGAAFLKQMNSLMGTVSYFGAITSLGESALKILSPGVPDIYQGTEIWSLYLVDPDNRRPVDYKKLSQFSKRAQALEARKKVLFDESLLRNWRTGEVKYRLIRQLLRFRERNPLLFEQGRYLPVRIKGPRQDQVIAFARAFESKWLLVLVPRYLASSMKAREVLSPAPAFWKDSSLPLPITAPGTWTNLLTGREYGLGEGAHELPLAQVFDGMPIAVLSGEMKSPEA